MNTDKLPPYISASDRVILFDDVCKLCNAWSNFIIKHDKHRLFKLCSVQSEEGQAILLHFGLPIDSYETMLYVEGNQSFQKSDAFFQVMTKLGFPWKMACIFNVIPRPVRDWMYDRIALNRYSLFGKYDYCTLPSPDHKTRFLNAKL
ncbi:thiol-disulfide oxidoreductase DCC family protein [Psychrobacter sp. JB385]|uniref:thiol-disulfide oxidoreductase DCC family protein n=1 Tax=Psychrobacter sp. JB385 TaxID=1434841 RepID=UPI00097EC151|nr:thiol-disulfide oxidoreductase DCC family protein [Psychrobacter sp. JB385]SJN32318.1 probable membrane protein YPO1564 [Psychrobacter sp. JB385]